MSKFISNDISSQDLFKDLQDYMLDERTIMKSLEMKIQPNTSKNTNTNTNTNKKLGKKEQAVGFYNNSNNSNNNNNNNNNNTTNNTNAIMIPCEKDTLFWCFYIMTHGDIKYELLENRNVVLDKKIKIEYVEKMRKEKQLLKTYKFATLTHTENKLANESKIDLKTFLSLCVIENVNIFYVNKKTYFEHLMNDSSELHIIYHLDNDKFGYELNVNSSEKVLHFKSTLFKIDNIDKPIKSISAYKSQELIDFCSKLAIETINKETNKAKSKTQLYEAIVQYF